MPKTKKRYSYELQLMQMGLKISYYRKMKGLTQEELAEKVNVNPSYISQIERPTKVQAISLKLLYDIADALDVEPYILLHTEA